MKNKGFIILLIDSCLALLLTMIPFNIFQKYYATVDNIGKLFILLAMIIILPICLGIVVASISGKETIGRKLMNQMNKKRKSSEKK